MKKILVLSLLLVLIPSCLASSLGSGTDNSQLEALLGDLQYAFKAREYDEAVAVCSEIDALELRDNPFLREIEDARNYSLGMLELAQDDPDYVKARDCFKNVNDAFPNGNWANTPEDETAVQLRNYCDGMRLCKVLETLAPDKTKTFLPGIERAFGAAGWIRNTRVLFNKLDSINADKILLLDTAYVGACDARLEVMNDTGEVNGLKLEYYPQGMPSLVRTVPNYAIDPDDFSSYVKIEGLIPDTAYFVRVTPLWQGVKIGKPWEESFTTVRKQNSGNIRVTHDRGRVKTQLLEYYTVYRREGYLLSLISHPDIPANKKTYTLLGETLDSSKWDSAPGRYGLILLAQLERSSYSPGFTAEVLVVLRGLFSEKEGEGVSYTCAQTVSAEFGGSKLAWVGVYLDDMLTSVRAEAGGWPEQLVVDMYINGEEIHRSALKVE